jgi:pimeloyl-ACP methyl ester carboxylesterase
MFVCQSGGRFLRFWQAKEGDNGVTWATRHRSDCAGLAAIRAGAGPDVLLLHGVGLRAEAWGAQIDALAGHACVTAPDMPGHGKSPASGSDATLDAYVQAALGVLNSLAGPALVVGHSMGAMIAIALAMRAPERVAGLVALNAVFERSVDAAHAVQARAARLDTATAADPSATLQRWFGDALTPEREACAGWLRSVCPVSYKTAYSAFAQSTLPDRAMLASLACPALFMTGGAEPNSTPAMSEAMARLAPRGRAIIVEGAAHMMPMTHAGIVNAALIDFLGERRA